MATIEEMEVRISKLEKQSFFRFFVEIVAIPLVLLGITLFFNIRLETTKANLTLQIETAKQDVQRVELAQKMIPELFSGDPYKAFATQRLLICILDNDNNRNVRNEIRNFVKHYYLKKIDSYLQSGKDGDLEQAYTIYLAAECLEDEESKDFRSVFEQKKANQPQKIINKLDGLQLAIQKERDGFELLISGKYSESIKAFNEANDAFPKYHCVSEISNLLKTSGDLNNKEVRKSVIKRIVDEFSWKAPSDLLDQLRQCLRNGV